MFSVHKTNVFHFVDYGDRYPGALLQQSGNFPQKREDTQEWSGITDERWNQFGCCQAVLDAIRRRGNRSFNPVPIYLARDLVVSNLTGPSEPRFHLNISPLSFHVVGFGSTCPREKSIKSSRKRAKYSGSFAPSNKNHLGNSRDRETNLHSCAVCEII